MAKGAVFIGTKGKVVDLLPGLMPPGVSIVKEELNKLINTKVRVTPKVVDSALTTLVETSKLKVSKLEDGRRVWTK